MALDRRWQDSPMLPLAAAVVLATIVFGIFALTGASPTVALLIGIVLVIAGMAGVRHLERRPRRDDAPTPPAP